MKAIILPEYDTNLVRAMRSLQVNEFDLPELKGDQVLVKLEMTPCNPSDIAFLRGMYNIRREAPVVPGFEACGEVISAGYMREARDLLGNRVSCFVQDRALPGTWAEYFIAQWQDCIELRRDLPPEQAATLCVNPFTSYALFEIIQASGTDTFIQNGASGQVGLFLRKMARQKGIKTINLVRKEEQVTNLKSEGEDYVLNINDENFADSLTTLAHDLGATVAVDAVGGENSGTIFNAMPESSKLVLYGGLSGQQVCHVETMDLIFRNKTITGFNLGDWKNEIGQQRFLDIALELEDMIMKREIETQSQGIFNFNQVQEGLKKYIRNMSAGKVFFTP